MLCTFLYVFYFFSDAAITAAARQARITRGPETACRKAWHAHITCLLHVIPLCVAARSQHSKSQVTCIELWWSQACCPILSSASCLRGAHLL
jgi:hypothetical protein